MGVRLRRFAVLVCASGAVPGAWAAPAPASPGYAEIAEPQGGAGYAIETVPNVAVRTDRPAPVPAPAAAPVRRFAAPPVLPTAPPMTVVIRFDGRHQGDAAAAAVLAASLTRRGISVSETGVPAPAGARTIGFMFAEDQAAAEALVPMVPASLGHFAPTRIDPGRMADPQPGLIQITLGEDRSTS